MQTSSAAKTEPMPGSAPQKSSADKDEQMVQQQFDELLERCASICKNEEDYNRIRAAFYFANEAHRGVKRHSGEPYITHPLAVARIVVVEIGLGVKSVMAALLHDVVEDTDYALHYNSRSVAQHSFCYAHRILSFSSSKSIFGPDTPKSL